MDWNLLDEDSDIEYKYYAKVLGAVKEVDSNSDETVALIDVIMK